MGLDRGRVASPVLRAIWIVSLIGATVGLARGFPDGPYVQEYHETHIVGEMPGCNDVRAITADHNDTIWIATEAGIYRSDRDTGQWGQCMAEIDVGPAYDIAVDDTGAVWIGAWNGMYRSTPKDLTKVQGINHLIAALCADGDTIVGLGLCGIWRIAGNDCAYTKVPYSRHFRAVVPTGHGGLWIGTGMGLYRHTDTQYRLYQSQSELVSPDVYDIAHGPDDTLWIGGFGGITVYRDDARMAHSHTEETGCPVCPFNASHKGLTGSCGLVQTLGSFGTMDGTGRFGTADAGW